jgi:septal ring factor EnvC (AmiA/AmiB activator)
MKYIFIVIALLINSSVYARSVKEYKEEISSKSQELESLQKSLEKKKIEKEEYQKREESTKKELDDIEFKLSTLNNKGIELKSQIAKAQNNLKIIERDLKLAGWEKDKWKGTITNEIDVLNRNCFSNTEYFPDLVSEKLCTEILLKKKEYFSKAERKESISKLSLAKWQQAKAKLLKLVDQLGKTTAQHKDIRKKKEKLLQTAIGKRIAAESEIKELESSSQELKKLLSKLAKEKKKTEQETQAKKQFVEKKGQLPWPVAGKVITNFGKNKHPELDTYIISNGIKILTLNGTSVKAVGNGEVMFCGSFRAYGQMVIVDHGGGFYTIYGNLGEISVKEGSKVKLNDPIGVLNNNGEKDAVLYFEVRREGTAEDPMLWLK